MCFKLTEPASSRVNRRDGVETMMSGDSARRVEVEDALKVVMLSSR